MGVLKIDLQHSVTSEVQTRLSASVFVLSTLIDSRATGNFMDGDTVQHLQIPTQLLQQPLKISTIDGALIGSGIITSYTKSLILQVSARYYETTYFFVIVTKNQPIIMRLPWIQEHNPQISWLDREILH